MKYFWSFLAEHLLSHLEQAKGAPQGNQNDALPEKAVEAHPSNQPVICENTNIKADMKRKPQRGRKPKVAKGEAQLVIVDDKDHSGETYKLLKVANNGFLFNT